MNTPASSSTSPITPTILQIEVIGPDGTMLSTPGQSVSSENVCGPFDILAEHEHFISLVENYLRIIDLNKKQIEYQFKTGVLRCFNNKVEIFLLESQ